MKTQKAFYRYTLTGQIFAIESRLDGAIVGSCGRLKEDNLRDLDSYDYTDKLNLWLQEVSDRLVLMDT